MSVDVFDLDRFYQGLLLKHAKEYYLIPSDLVEMSDRLLVIYQNLKILNLTKQ